jgi:hypothetical protein
MDNQKQVASDEIDLGVLFSKIGDFFKSLGMGFLRSLATLRLIPIKHKNLFIALSVVSVTVGYFYSTGLISKKYYKTSMVLSSDYLNNRILENSIEKLNLLADEKSKTGLSKALNIPESIAHAILGFKAKPIIDEKETIEIEILREQLKNLPEIKKNENEIKRIAKQIQIENRHSFEITVFVSTASTISILEEAIINYFKNADYVKKRLDITRINLLAKQTKLIKESEKLDSLKKVIFDNYQSMAKQSKQGSNNVIFSDRAVTDPITVYKQDQEIYDSLQSVERRLFLQPDFELVSGLTEFTEPASPSLAESLAISILIAFGLGYAIIALVNFNKYLSSLV